MPRFTFDDNNTSDVWAAEILWIHRLKGAFFLNDKPGIEYDVENLLRYGMVVGNHTAHHIRINEVTPQQIVDEVLSFNDKLLSLLAAIHSSTTRSSTSTEGMTLNSQIKMARFRV